VTLALAFEPLDEQENPVQLHPALDMVDNSLYVTVRVPVKGEQKPVDVVLVSQGGQQGHVLTQDEWQAVASERGIVPYNLAPNLARCGPRWNGRGVLEWASGTREAPTWQETYEAIYRTYDSLIEVRDKRYLVVLTTFATMTYFHPMFDFLPPLHPLGPTESGKSRSAIVVGHTSFNGMVNGAATRSTVFRRAHKARYTK
jgi:hypothetical protein